MLLTNKLDIKISWRFYLKGIRKKIELHQPVEESAVEINPFIKENQNISKTRSMNR